MILPIGSSWRKRMNKRKQKTKEKIYDGLSCLIEKKGYQNITIEDILKASGVSRSTFYAYFKKKEDVLSDICSTIFDHVFSAHLEKEKNHDFSSYDIFDYTHYITHMFYHIKEEGSSIRRILLSDGRDIFLNDLENRLSPFIGLLIRSGDFKKDVPEKLLSLQLTQGLVCLLSYWVEKDFDRSPEEETSYFLELYRTKRP